jgi:phosphoribosyl 1,2-cyclic phosphate phosphodiesterase
MDVYAAPRVQEALRRDFFYVFSGANYPGIPQLTLHTITDKPFEAAGLKFTPIEVMHMKLPVLGFRIGDFTFITDANYISEEEKKKVRGSKVIVLNALRREKHVSHYNLDEAIALVNELKPEQAYFVHISHQMGLHDAVNKALPPNIQLAWDGLKIEV